MTFNRHDPEYNHNRQPSQSSPSASNVISFPKLEPLWQLIIDVWSQQPGDWFFICTKDEDGFWEEHPIARKDIEQLVGELIKEHGDKNLYWCCHGYSKPSRKIRWAVLPTMLWADLDGADPRKIKPRPTIALESSPGRFVGYWRTDKTITAELNQRLTYHVGADKGGHAVTKVLRIPGTKNYKYEAEPEVKVLWDETEGPAYTIADIEKLLPKPKKQADKVTAKAWDIWKKYRLKSLELANLIEGDKPADRSGAQGQSYVKMSKIGMSADEIEIVWRSVSWAKGGDQDQDKGPGWLRKDIERMLGKEEEDNPFLKKRKSVDNDADGDDDGMEARQHLADVNMSGENSAIEWVFPDWMSTGIYVLAGPGGIGKTSALVSLLRRVAQLGDKDARFSCELRRKIVYLAEEPDQVRRILRTEVRIEEYTEEELNDWFRLQLTRKLSIEQIAEHLKWAIEAGTVKGPNGYLVRPVIAIDTASATFDIEDENSNSEVSKLVAAIKTVNESFTPRACIIAVAHMSKGVDRGEIATMSARGAGAWGDDANGLIFLITDAKIEHSRFMHMKKTRNEVSYREIEFTSEVYTEKVPKPWGGEQEQRVRVSTPKALADGERKEKAAAAAQAKKEAEERKLEEAVMYALATMKPEPGEDGLSYKNIGKHIKKRETDVRDLLNELVEDGTVIKGKSGTGARPKVLYRLPDKKKGHRA